MKLSFYPVIVFTAVLVASCGDGTTGIPSDASVIVPLSIGNTWIARYRRFAPDGTLLEEEEVKESVVKDTVTDGERWSIYGSSWLVNRADGLYDWEYPRGAGGINKILLFKYPARPGDTYRCDLRPGWPRTMTVIATDEKVTIDGASYSCYHYRLTENQGEYELHYHLEPDKGMVRKEGREPDSTGAIYTEILWELKERRVQ